MFCSTLPVSAYVNDLCARLTEDMSYCFESRFPNFNAKPTTAHTHSVHATLQGNTHSVPLARRRLPASFHVKSSYSRAGPRICFQNEDTGIVCNKYTLHVYSKAHTIVKELYCVRVLSMFTRKRALSFQRHSSNIPVIDTCLAFVPATTPGKKKPMTQ